MEHEQIAGQPDNGRELTFEEHIKNHEKEEKYEMIKKSTHYNFFGKQAIDVIERTLSTEGYLGFLEGNALKYRLRAGNGKPGGSIDEDLMKAFYYEGLYNKFVKENTQ